MVMVALWRRVNNPAFFTASVSKNICLFDLHDAVRNPSLLFLNCPAHFLMTTAALECELESLPEPS